jgi:hypothetical protein
MRRATAGVAAVLTALAWAGSAAAADDPAPPPSFTKDVKPFLARYCMNCHSDAKPRAGYSVETFADLTRDGKRGALVTPGKPDDSRLLLSLAGKGKPMPPRKAAQPTPREAAAIRAWITAGAKDDTPADDDKKKPADAGR